MADISITVEQFYCSPPTVGATYRNNSGNYFFNYNWTTDIYDQYGMIYKVEIFYSGDLQPYEQYVGSTIPTTANNFQVNPGSFDVVSFKLKFSVNDGTVCEYNFDIPSSTIITI